MCWRMEVISAIWSWIARGLQMSASAICAQGAFMTSEAVREPASSTSEETDWFVHRCFLNADP